jgi:hypothetical protein
MYRKLLGALWLAMKAEISTGRRDDPWVLKSQSTVEKTCSTACVLVGTCRECRAQLVLYSPSLRNFMSYFTRVWAIACRYSLL